MTPPTYSSWLRVFEAFGRAGLVRRRVHLGKFSVGDPLQDLDVAGDVDWRQYATSEALYRLWGPAPESPWSPYHRPTLFAALDAVRTKPYPWKPQGPEPKEAPWQGPPWAGERRAVILDLPAELSVLYGALLARVSQYLPVVTFNNWPHAKEIIEMSRVLGSLLYMAPWIRDARTDLPKEAPPVFLLDSRRFGHRVPKPKDFDNRYYLLDADLPSGQYFVNHGIDTVVYVRLEGAKPDEDDLNGYLHDLPKKVGLETATVAPHTWSGSAAVDFRPAVRKTPLSTTKDPSFRGFRRNAAGGFGHLVPEPSSGGG